MDRPALLPPGRLRRHAAPAAVLATGVISAVLAAGFVSRAVEAQQDAHFAAEVAGSVDAIRGRMNAYTAMLRATRGLFEAEEVEPDVGTFRRFVASLEIARHFPGIQGIGWAKALAPAELAAHLEVMRRLFPDYRVWPEGERALYASIVYLEPLDWRNRRALGYDMFSDPTRRAAMERARDTGEVAASARVELVQETGADRQAGFLIYLAIYGRPPRTVADRSRVLLGWVYAPFRATDLLEGTLDPDSRGVGLAVYDGPEPTEDALLHRAAIGGVASRTRTERLEIAGRPWTLAYTAGSAFESRAERALPAAVLAAGVALALLLFGITRADARARARAERAARRAAFLADTGKALSASTDTGRTVADVAALAAARVADACLVLLLEPQGPVWAAGHADPAVAARAVERLRDLGPASAGPLGVPAAIARAAPATGPVPPAPPTGRTDAARAEDARAVAADLGGRLHLTVPLFARGEPIGAIVLLAGRRHRAFEPEDFPLAEDLARLVAASVDTSRLFRRAQEAVAARDEFLSIASHELKTPLTSLILHTDGLRLAARRGVAAQVTSKADLIRRSADRLSRLVTSLLDISRIGAGRLDLEREETDLADVAREVVERFEEEAHRAGCDVRLDTQPAVGFWDRLRLDQVVTNLLSNAIKYGAGAPIDVRVAARAGRAVLTVRDRGIGISEADQRRIFQRFERAVSERNYGGFGLGLWIVRQIVEAQGGSVRVESVPGEGSTFTVELETALRAPVPDPARPSP